MLHSHTKRSIQQHQVGSTVWWLGEMHPTHGMVLAVQHYGPHGYHYRLEGERALITGARVYASAEELALDLLCSTQQAAAAKAYYESQHTYNMPAPTFEQPYVYRVSISAGYDAGFDMASELGHYLTFERALEVASAQASTPADNRHTAYLVSIHRITLAQAGLPQRIWEQFFQRRDGTWIADKPVSTVPIYTPSQTLQQLHYEATGNEKGQ